MSGDFAIKVTDVSKKYTLKHPKIGANGEETREHWALNSISFEVKKGESVGIIGPNGSGKSTLLKILSGITKPTSGEVEIRGRVASILDIGAGFHPELSGRENVFLNGQLLGFTKQEINQKYDEIIAFSGIENFIHEPVKYYSNGMYLRLAFSILAHLDFDIYLFDEVMSVGDASFIQKSKQKIAELKTLGKTILLISHNLNELHFCNRLISLESGQIKQQGNEQDIISKYILAAIEKTEQTVHQHPVYIDTFKEEVNSSTLTLLSLSIHQNKSKKDTLSTNNPLFIDFEYVKHFKEDTLEPFLIVSDVNGVVVFVSSPILSADIFNEQKSGRYAVSCEIPSGFLSSNIYSLSLTFVKNSRAFKAFPSESSLSTDQIKQALSSYGILASYTNILFFRAKVVIENFIDLGQLNMPVGLLLPLLKWKTTTLD